MSNQVRIVIQGAPKEGCSTIARLIHAALVENNVAVEFVDGGNPHLNLKRQIRRVAEKLESPVELATEVAKPFKYTDYLFIDPECPEDGPLVKGTLVTVSSVVSHIVDGCSWKEILTTHPELTEDDIRACLAYTVEQEGEVVDVNRKTAGDKGYSRRCGVPHPL